MNVYRDKRKFEPDHKLYALPVPLPSLVVPASVCFFYCEKLWSIVKFISYFSRLLPPWVSCLPPSPLLPPVDFLPPLLLGPHPSVPLHQCQGTSSIFPVVHIISFCVSFLSRVDELNKLACLQCMGLHSSAGRAQQRERRGHGFKSR